MCDPVTISVAMAVSGGMSAYGQYQEGVATNKYYQSLADASIKKGEADYKTGVKQSELIQTSAKSQDKAQKLQAAEAASAQRAALAANGVDLSSVTAQDIASDTFSKAKMDELNLKYNADMKSWQAMEQARQSVWSSKIQADQYRVAGKNAKQAGKLKAFTTLVGTAASIGSVNLLATAPSAGGSNAASGTVRV